MYTMYTSHSEKFLPYVTLELFLMKSVDSKVYRLVTMTFLESLIFEMQCFDAPKSKMSHLYCIGFAE